jgi:hypothetical protein
MVAPLRPRNREHTWSSRTRNSITSVRDDPTTRRVSMGTCCAVAVTRAASLHHAISHHCRPARDVVAIVLQRDGDA